MTRFRAAKIRLPLSKLLAAAGLTTLCALAPAQAETYPSKPISLIVSFEPGGSTDISARAVATELAAALGQNVVVENKPGAGGRIGTKIAAQAKPDGYTLLWGSGSSLTAAPVLYSDQEHVATLMPVSVGATQPFVFVTNPASGVTTAADFIALAKKNPGKLNFGSAGTGSSNHLIGEIFMSATGAHLLHVPYKGAAAARNAVIKGEIDLMDEVTSPLVGAIRAKQVVPLFITGETRDPLFPDIPTAAEVGLPDLTITGFFGLLAPSGTPPAIVEKLNAAMKVALASPNVKKAFDNLGFALAYSTPEQMQARIDEGKAKYQRIVSERKIKIE